MRAARGGRHGRRGRTRRCRTAAAGAARTAGAGGTAGTTGDRGNRRYDAARPDRGGAAGTGGGGRRAGGSGGAAGHDRRRGSGRCGGRSGTRRHHRRRRHHRCCGTRRHDRYGGTGCAGYAFCDDFEDGDTVGWTPNGGTWSVITDGSRVYQGGNGNSFSLAGQPAWTDQTITARVKVTQWGGTSTSYRAGIVARATDASNQYVFAIDASGALRLLKGTSSPSGTGATGTCGKVTPAPPAAAGHLVHDAAEGRRHRQQRLS